MKDYKVYFEIFGKKMVTTIEAESKKEAELKIKEKIKFHKTVEVDYFKESMDILDEISNIFKSKK